MRLERNALRRAGWMNADESRSQSDTFTNAPVAARLRAVRRVGLRGGRGWRCLFEAINAGLEDAVYVLRSEPDSAVELVSPSVHALVSCTPQEHYDDPELVIRIVDPRDLDVILSAAKADEKDLHPRLATDGIELWLSQVQPDVRELLDRAGALAIIGQTGSTLAS